MSEATPVSPESHRSPEAPVHPRPSTPTPPESKKSRSDLVTRLLTAVILIPSLLYIITLGGLWYLATIILIAHPENKLLGKRFHLAPGAALGIGRDPSSGVSLPDVPSVSRNHALLRHRGGNVTIEDLGSANGTYINDRPVDSLTLLQSGDRFQLGAVHFKLLNELDIETAYHDAMFELANRDGLTGAYNKRRFDSEIEREFRRILWNCLAPGNRQQDQREKADPHRTMSPPAMDGC